MRTETKRYNIILHWSKSRLWRWSIPMVQNRWLWRIMRLYLISNIPNQWCLHIGIGQIILIFTFKINFTNNDTSVVHSVTLYVKTSSNEVVPLKAVYDNTIKQWVATGKFGSNSLPVNLSVNYSANADSYIDGDELSDIKTDISNLNSDLQSQLADLNKAFDSSSDSLIGHN